MSAFAFWQLARESSARVHSVVKCELNFAQFFALFLDQCHAIPFVCSGSFRLTEAEYMKRVPRCINSFAYSVQRGVTDVISATSEIRSFKCVADGQWFDHHFWYFSRTNRLFGISPKKAASNNCKLITFIASL